MKLFLTGLLIFFLFRTQAQESWTTNCAGALPVVKEIMIHPCGTSGESEFEILSTGSSPFKLTDFKITSSVPNGTSIGSAVVNAGDNNTAAIDLLNNAVGTCAYGHTFVNVQAAPYWGTVPNNSILLIFNDKDNIDLSYLSPNALSGFCGSKIFTAFGTTTSINADKTLFPNFAQAGSCGVSCLRQLDFQVNGSSNCTKVVYDISKLPNGKGASIVQNGNGIKYDGGISNPQATDCLPAQNLSDAPCTNFPTHVNDVILPGNSVTFGIALTTGFSNFLALTNPYNVHWTGPTVLPDNKILVSNLSPGKYVMHVIEGRGCESDINVFVLPPNGFVISLSGDTLVCPNMPTQIQATITGGQSPFKYNWTKKSDSTQVAGNSPSTFLTQDTTTDYVLTVTDGNNITQTQNFTIHTLPKPNVTVTLLPDSIVCNEVVLTIIGSGAKSFVWSSQPSIATSALSSTTGDTVKLYTILLPAPGYDIIATGTDANGCVNTGKKSLVVHPLPKVTINPIPDSICVTSAPIKLTGYPTTGGTYYGTCGICVQGDYFYPQFASLDPQKPNTISHKVIDSYACVNAPSIVINVKDCTCLTPVTVFAGNDLQICENAIAILHGKYTNATSATWSTSGSGQFGDVHALITTYSPSIADFTNGSVVIKLAADAPITPNCNIRADSFTLTLAKKAVTNFSKNICKGDSFRINKLWYKQTGSYSDTLSTIYGCDSIVNVNLTVNRTDSTFFYLTSCNASDVGIKYKTLKNTNNCDSVIVTNTRFTPATTGTANKSICAGDSLFFQNKYLSVPGTYTFKTLNVNSCDSTITLNLSLNAVNKILKTATTCNPNNAGTATEFFKNVFGCDSSITTTTTFVPLDTFKIFATTCDINSAGTFIKKYTNSYGCDSVVSTKLDYAKSAETDLKKSICKGDSIFFNNLWLKGSDTSQFGLSTYAEKTISINGCDSIVTLYLTVNKPDTLQINIVTCDYKKSGLSKNIFKNKFGCDSTVYTTTTFIKSDTINVINYTCDSTQSGVFVKKYTNTGGCDSVVTTTLIFTKIPQTSFNKTICKGDSVLFNGLWVKTAQIYSLKTIASNGCDSLVTMNLFVNKTDTIQKTFTTCNPNKIGATKQVFKNSLGCDSTIVSTTNLMPLDTFRITGTTCDAAKAGMSVKKYTNIAGCDSVVATTLTFAQTAKTNFDKTICNGDSILFNNVWVKTTNTYSLKTIGVSGCDSIVTMNLRVNKKDTIFMTALTCDSTKAGTTKKLFSNSGGCDSLVITTSTFTKIDSVILKQTSCNVQDTGTFVQHISVGSDCDKVTITQISFAAIPINSFAQTICNGDSVFFDNQWFKTANTYQKIYKTAKGCDSSVVLNLSVTNKIVTKIDTFTCDAIQVGTKTLSLKSKSGCDSTVIINTQLGESGSFVKDSVSCNPRDTGVFVSTIPQQGGCNKTLTTTIRLGKIDFQSRNAAVCSGDSLQFNRQWVKIKGNYSKIFKNTQGCDSTITLTLDVLQRDTVFINKKSCNARDTGIVRQNFKKANGCDSLVITQTQLNSSSFQTNLAQLKPTSCYNGTDGGAYIKNISGGTPAYKYRWQNGFTGDTVRNVKSGWITLSITDANNCSTTDSVFVSQPLPINPKVVIKSPTCYGQTDGSINLDTILGGTSPYTLFYDGKNIQFKDIKNRIAGIGNHSLKITDAHNCTLDTLLFVNEAPKRTVLLGTELKINLGDSVYVGSFLNFKPKTIKWTPPDGLTCDTCLPTTARPKISTTYSLVLTDSSDCIITDKFPISVSDRRDIYIPTAFSPDGNGINDKFILYSDNSVEKILRMQIYNRWGSLVFSKSDCLPNVEAEGWNGTFNSTVVVPDIYIYFFEVLFKDGQVEIFSGDVSLVR